MPNWFSGIVEAVTRCKEHFSSLVLASISASAVGLFMPLFKKVLFIAFICTMALGGSIVGTVAGGIRSRPTRDGFLEGAGKGAVLGAIAAMELVNYATNTGPIPEVPMLSTFLDANLIMEWMHAAASRAYALHFEMNISESSYYGIGELDMYGGMPQSLIQKLPFQQYNSSKMVKLYDNVSCSICLQDFEDEELVRILPNCDHLFHLECVDKWLILQESCPMCRTYVPYL